MLALRSMLLPPYYAQNYAGIIGSSLPRGVYGTPNENKIKHPLEALFVIVLKTPTKELPKLPIFNGVSNLIVGTNCYHSINTISFNSAITLASYMF